MSKLLDKLRENLSGDTAAPTNVPPGPGQQSIQDLMAAKQGKAVSRTGPQQSNIRERLAGTQVQEQTAALQQQGKLGAAQIGEASAGIAQTEQLNAQKAAAARTTIQRQALRNSSSLLNQYRRDSNILENKKFVAELEQTGFQVRLTNEQYVNQLELEGARGRLDDELKFKYALAESMYGVGGDKQQLLEQDLLWKTTIEGDERAFREEVSKIDINYALEMAEEQITADNTRSAITAVGEAGSAGIKYAATPDDDEDET